MSHRYFPHTPEDIRRMLDRCGAGSLDELYADVPEELRLKDGYDLPEAKSEKEVRDYFDAIGRKNRQLTLFAGAGYYDHYTPAVIPYLMQRSEFLTAYTPYQPEISQGTLQYIFEYQSMIATLTGMEVSNASMYDGSTATAEAMMMAVSAARRRHRVLVSATLNPAVRRVVDTYARYHGIQVDTVCADEATGCMSRESLTPLLAEGDVAAVIVASPNYYGILEDFTGVADMVHEAKALLIMHTVPSDLGLIRTPAEWGADIAVGDGQSLGMPLSYGGPYLGFIATSKTLMRRMPGRIVGATTDAEGRRVFVLTLQAREQHIRRDKATSNICSNQGIMTLFAAVYLSVAGPEGLRRICEESRDGLMYLRDRLTATGRMEPRYPDSPVLNETVMRCHCDIDDLMVRCVDAGILPGIKISDRELLICVTEMVSRADCDRLVEIVSQCPITE